MIFFPLFGFLLEFLAGSFYIHKEPALWVRRIYVILFPISFPLLFLACAIVLPLAVIESLLVGIFSTASRLWEK